MLAVTILGNNSALPMHERHPTAQVVTDGERLFLVDCGEGTQIQMIRYKIRRSRIGHIFISHLHGDHYYGLIGLLNSYNLSGRTEPIHLYAPPALQSILDLQMEAADSDFAFPLHFHPLGEDGVLFQDARITISTFRVRHGIPCWGFLFRENAKPRKVDPDKAFEAGVPPEFFPSLKAGDDFVDPSGRRIANGLLTRPGPRPRSYAYCADTMYHEPIADQVRGVDLVYHEATYLDDQRQKAAARHHCTALQAARIAKLAGVGRLILGHFSSKYEDLDVFREEASAEFPDVEVCREGATYLAG